VNKLSGKKEKIIEAAFELFTEKGFNATTTKEIAVKSGVAEGLIYYYFKDKNQLLSYLTRQFSFIESIRDDIKRLDGLDPKKAVYQFCDLYTGFLLQHKKYLSFIWSPEIVDNEHVSAEVMKLLASMSESVCMLLSRAVDSVVDQQELETASSMVLSSLMTFILIQGRIADASSEERENYINGVVTLIINGLRK
jgi:AcrR family transcriptional regulator